MTLMQSPALTTPARARRSPGRVIVKSLPTTSQYLPPGRCLPAAEHGTGTWLHSKRATHGGYKRAMNGHGSRPRQSRSISACMLWRCLSPLRLSTATTQLLTPDGFFYGRYQTRDADEEQFKILVETQLRELSFCLVFAAHHCQCSGSALIAHQGAPGWVL